MSTNNNLSNYIDDTTVMAQEGSIDDLSQKLHIKLSEAERAKIISNARKFLNVFNSDLSDFKATINDATNEDIDLLSEFNLSQQVLQASSTIRAKVSSSTADLDHKQQSIIQNDFKRNLFDLILQKSKEEKEREVLSDFMPYLKNKQDEFETFSQEITVNINNLAREKDNLKETRRVLSKKAIMLQATSSFFKNAIVSTEAPSDYELKLTALDRRVRTMLEIIYMTEKNVTDIENQIDMYNQLQDTVDEYKFSAMRILSMEVKNRIVLQDIKAMYESLNNARTSINRLISDNSKITKELVKDIHTLSKESILDKEVVSQAMDNALEIKNEKQQRNKDIHNQINRDNQEYISKIDKVITKNEQQSESNSARLLINDV